MKRILSFLPVVVSLAVAWAFLANGIALEPPVGSLEGTAVMKENGRPLPEVWVSIGPSDWKSKLPDRTALTDKNGHYRIRDVAVGEYRVFVSAKAHESHDDNVEIEEGKNTTLVLQLQPRSPYLEVHTAKHVYSPNSAPEVQLSGFVPQNEVGVTVTKLDPDRVAESGGLNATFSPLSTSERVQGPEHFGTQFAKYVEPLKKDVEGVFIKRVRLPSLPEGIYWVECGAGGVHDGSYLNVTHLAMIAKFADDKVLAYTVDIDSGQPVPNVPIFTATEHGMKPAGTTDSQGLADVTLAVKAKRVVIARRGDSLAVCSRDYADMSEKEGSGTVFIYTDRSIYRPGDTIQFKGLVRHRQGLDYSLPKPGAVQLELQDESENVLRRQTVEMNAKGNFAAAFVTSKEQAPGGLHIVAKTPEGEGKRYVPIADYRKPDYTITVMPGKDYYVLGETAKATIDCAYYYGGPVVGAKVDVSIYRSEDWGGSAGDDEDDEEDSGNPDESWSPSEFRGGTFDQHVTAVTDENGRAVVEFPTKADDDPDEVDTDFTYTINADVADVANHYFTGTGSVSVVRGDYNLDVSTDKYVADPGETVDVTVTATTEGPSPVPAPGRQVTLVTGTETWDDGDSKFHPSATYTGVSGADGLAHFSVPVGNQGSLRLDATTTDLKGRRIRAEGYVYVSGDQDLESGSSQGTIHAILDRKQYAVGATAKLMLQSSSPGGVALLTFETDSILSRRLVPMTQKSILIQVPVDKTMAPNVYISVAYIRDQQYMETNEELRVTRKDRDLQVTVTPDEETTQPGKKVGFEVETKDAQGNPVAADASLAVVDEAIFAIRHDSTDVRRGFYPYRQDNVDTSYSFPEIYLDGGDKGSGQMPVRSRFLDTAAWVPDVETGLDGKAHVQVQLPDNLTKWRATAVACTSNAEVGKGMTGVVARKPLMVIVHAPPQLVAEDKQEVQVTVTNDTDADADVRLSLSCKGIASLGEVPATLRVPSGKSTSTPLTLTAPTSGNATVTATATLPNGGGDAVRMAIFVKPRGETMTESKSGMGSGAVELSFEKKASADPNTGDLRINVYPSLAASLVGPMHNLIDFPYGCVEQTMSRFMPSVLVVKAFKDTGMPEPSEAKQLPQIAEDAFIRLTRFQHQDGGWGWWQYDASDISLTALVLDGLKRASEAGYTTPSSIRLEKAFDWAEKRLSIGKPDKYDATERIYLAYALARYGRPHAARALAPQLKNIALGVEGDALLALMEGQIGKSPAAQLDALRRRAGKGTGAFAFVPGRYEWSWGEEANAMALVALTTLAPDDPLIQRLEMGILRDRRGDSWMSTRDTSYVLIGFAKDITHRHETYGQGRVEVLVDGKPVRTVGTVDLASTFDVPIGQLPSGKFKVELKPVGTSARMVYSAQLTQVAVGEGLTAHSSDPDITVSREYHTLQPERMVDGSLRMVPSKSPVTTVPTGTVVMCKLTITSKRDGQFMQLEAPTPSNCHVTEREDPMEGDQWSWWWSQTVIRSDRIAFFSRYLEKGKNEITFAMRAESVGTSTAMPVVVENMYDPTDRATSDATTLEVTK